MAAQNLIFKITPKSEWEEAERAGFFDGAPIDLADGFIHFSTREQTAETAGKHFTGQEGLLLAAIDPKALGDDLKFEVSRGGDLFPHLYARLNMDAVVWARPMPLDEDGKHILPFEGE